MRRRARSVTDPVALKVGLGEAVALPERTVTSAKNTVTFIYSKEQKKIISVTNHPCKDVMTSKTSKLGCVVRVGVGPGARGRAGWVLVGGSSLGPGTRRGVRAGCEFWRGVPADSGVGYRTQRRVWAERGTGR